MSTINPVKEPKQIQGIKFNIESLKKKEIIDKDKKLNYM